MIEKLIQDKQAQQVKMEELLKNQKDETLYLNK